jgi:hypothetical protein
MSLISITGAFREIVIREFISYCEKAGSDIDNVMLSELGGSFCDTKHNISKDMTPNKDQKKKGKKKDDITPDNFSRMPEVVVGKCMARTFAKGFGAQCSRNTCADSEDYCTRHMKSSLESNDKAQPYPALGRIDKPRCACRLDNGRPLGWRSYLGTGPVEEICEEFDAGVGVGDDISIPESEEFDTDHVVRSISAQNLVIDDDDDTLSPEPEIIISEKVVEENVVENNVVEETVVEDTVVEENVVEEKVVEEKVVEEKVVEEKVVEEKVVEEKVVEEKVVEEKVVEEKVVEENKFPKMGLFQGVKYLFGEENIHGENPVMIMGYKGQTSVVGTFTDDEVILNEEYESTHEFSATDPEQDDVIWIGKSISQDIYGFPK